MIPKKDDDKTDSNNYGSISVTSLGKIFEKVMATRLYNDLKLNKLLANNKWLKHRG